MEEQQPLITILGPTASGKTHLAVQLSALIGGEVISADSRQVYRGMDIGSGKDLDEYRLPDGRVVPHHLIDIKDPGYEYNVFEFQQDFLRVFEEINQRGAQTILCGGTGMYIDAILRGYRMLDVPRNLELRADLAEKTDEELRDILGTYRDLHNTTDTADRKRLVNAIEIADYQQHHREEMEDFPGITHHIFGIRWERSILRERITERLRQRLEQGMVAEVEGLLKQGFTADQLKFYGLEYRFVTQYIQGELNYNDMYQKLNTAIHAFAKRQMTWFRRMERNGVQINWLEGDWPDEKKLRSVMAVLRQY